MSEENVEIVRRLYQAMNAGNLEAVSELAHPNVEWIPDRRLGQRPIRGRKNIIRFFMDQAEPFEEFRVETERFWDLDNKVLVFLRTTGRGAASGAGFDMFSPPCTPETPGKVPGVSIWPVQAVLPSSRSG